jgi:hypothetical protein
MAGPLIILPEPGWAQGQSCPGGIWLIWGAFVRRTNKVYNDLSRDRTITLVIRRAPRHPGAC